MGNSLLPLSTLSYKICTFVTHIQLDMSHFIFFLFVPCGSLDYAEHVSGDLAVGMTAASHLRVSRVESRVENLMTKILIEAFSVTCKGSLRSHIILESRNDAPSELLHY